MQDSFIPDTATIEMKDDEIIIPPQNKTAKNLLLPIEGTTITQKELDDFSDVK